MLSYISVFLLKKNVASFRFSWISDTMTHVTLQLQLLWKKQMVDILFVQLPSLDDDEAASQAVNTTQQRKPADRGINLDTYGSRMLFIKSVRQFRIIYNNL